MSIENKNKRVGMCLKIVAGCAVFVGLWAVLAAPGTALAEAKSADQNLPVIVDVVNDDPGVSTGLQSTLTDFEFDLILNTDEEGFEVDSDIACVTIRIPRDGSFHIIFREGALELNDPASPGAHLDLDATDGYATIYIPGIDYDVSVQAQAKPGTSIAWGQPWRFDPLWQEHTVIRSTGRPIWEGPWRTHFYRGFWSWTSPPFINNGLSCLAMRWFPL